MKVKPAKGWTVVVDGESRFIIGNERPEPVRSIKNLAKSYDGYATPVTITARKKGKK